MAKKTSRKIRVRKKLKSKSLRPRLSVFVSNKHVYAQIIDDEKGITIAQASDKSLKPGKTLDTAREVGTKIAIEGKAKGVKQVALDRGGRKYHGRIKTLADAAREGGLEF